MRATVEVGSPVPSARSTDPDPAHPILVLVERGGMVESVHRGSALVLAADGGVVASAGDPDAVHFPRSAVKPLQAIGMLLAGLALDAQSLALATGSHSGQPGHLACLRAMLADAGASIEDLGCPPALPLNEAARGAVLAAGGGPERRYMNCSGKHAAMLLTCLANGWPTQTYLDLGHPLQVHLHRVLSEYAGEVVGPDAVDGCGAPLFGMTLAGLARGFLRLTDEPGPARTVADAMRAHPFYVAGTGREDTDLMSGLPGVVCKAGAEGVHAAAVPGRGAVVVKIDDGNERARMPVIVAGLRLLGLRGEVLDHWAGATVLGGGIPVGTVCSAPDLFAGPAHGAKPPVGEVTTGRLQERLL